MQSYPTIDISLTLTVGSNTEAAVALSLDYDAVRITPDATSAGWVSLLAEVCGPLSVLAGGSCSAAVLESSVSVLDHPRPHQAHPRSHEPAGHRRCGLQARHRGAEAMAAHQRLRPPTRQRLGALTVQGRPPGATREPARSSRRAAGRLMQSYPLLTLA